jgi:hypothetical protein
MLNRAVVYRVMIGSPSDLAAERDAATEAINEWNAHHADDQGAVLLPVKWETHAILSTRLAPSLNPDSETRTTVGAGMSRPGRRVVVAGAGGEGACGGWA